METLQDGKRRDHGISQLSTRLAKRDRVFNITR
jgi:hypothetical protein